MDCSYNNLTSLDLSENTGLDVVYCDKNPLKKIIVCRDKSEYRGFVCDEGVNVVIAGQQVERTPGDVDGDGEITVIDCLYLKRYILGTFSGDIDLENADVDGNGRIDAMDYLYLKRGYLGTFDLSKFA